MEIRISYFAEYEHGAISDRRHPLAVYVGQKEGQTSNAT